jgi:hypothetical protein
MAKKKYMVLEIGIGIRGTDPTDVPGWALRKCAVAQLAVDCAALGQQLDAMEAITKLKTILPMTLPAISRRFRTTLLPNLAKNGRELSSLRKAKFNVVWSISETATLARTVIGQRLEPCEADDVEGANCFPDPGQRDDSRSAPRARHGRTARAGLGREADSHVRYWSHFSASFPKLRTVLRHCSNRTREAVR